MNEIIGGLAAFTAAVVVWGLGRRPHKPILKNNDASLVAGINRSQITLLGNTQQKKQIKGLSAKNYSAFDWQTPKTVQDRKNLLLELKQLMSSGPDERLIAIKICSEWGHSSVMPFLRKGLRDSDNRVVKVAAEGMAKKKGGRNQQLPLNQDKRPPRNVALMR